jgi:hypothetical protein
LWRAEQLVFYGTNAANAADNAFPEPLGFIGVNYQRFYLHYTSVRPAPGQHYGYQVSGKTQVKTNVCPFTGTITVVKAQLYKAPNNSYPKLREGELAEDRRAAAPSAARSPPVSTSMPRASPATTPWNPATASATTSAWPPGPATPRPSASPATGAIFNCYFAAPPSIFALKPIKKGFNHTITHG